MRAALCRVLRAEPHELSALAWAFAYFFLLLCSYYLLRPVRDALAVEAGTEKLQWLFTGTFAAMLALVPAFGWLCARLPRARLLPVVYAFFALSVRSEEHTSELQSLAYLVCRLLLEKKKIPLQPGILILDPSHFYTIV